MVPLLRRWRYFANLYQRCCLNRELPLEYVFINAFNLAIGARKRCKNLSARKQGWATEHDVHSIIKYKLFLGFHNCYK